MPEAGPEPSRGEPAPPAASGRGEPVSPPGTPLAWRVITLAVLLGGLALGAVAAGGGGAIWLVVGSIIVVGASLAPIIVASRRPPIPPEPLPAVPLPGMPVVTVVIAARDEVAVLPRLIEDLAAQDHRDRDGSPRFEIIVVDDRSVDGTGEAALAAAARLGLRDAVRVIRREGPGLRDGKGAALAAASPDLYRGSMVVALDADARVGPTFVRQIAAYAARGVPALTARRRLLGAGESQLAGAQADEQTQDGELQRGRWATDGCSEFRGNGTTISRDLLVAVGGWPADALTEDLDLSSRVVAATGVTVAWALDLEVWEEPVRTWAELWRQRQRWSEGAIRRYLEHGLAVLRSPRVPFRARLDFAAYGAQLAVPPIIIGGVLAAAATGAAGMALALAATYLAAGGILAFDALRWEATASGPVPPPARLGRAIRAALFGFVWLGAVPAAMLRLATRRGHVRYDKMTHVGSDGDPGPQPHGAAHAEGGPGER